MLLLSESILLNLMPGLIEKLNSDIADIRFFSIKIFTDILGQLMYDDNIYRSKDELKQVQNQPGSSSIINSSKIIDSLIIDQLFPLIKNFMKDNHPMPLFGLKLLQVILERNPTFGVYLKRYQGLLNAVVDPYMVNHAQLNKHVISVMKILVESKSLSHEELSQFKVIEKTHLILKNTLAKDQDWCIDLLLDIIHSLLSEFNEVMKTNEEGVRWATDSLFSNFDICVQLLSNAFEVTIMEKASQCLI